MRTGRISVSGLLGRGKIVVAAPSGGSAPSAPTGLSAIAGDSIIALTWSPSSGATSYRVKRSTSPTGPFNSVLGSPSSPAYNDSAVVNGTAYYYVVSAVNGFGTSADTAAVGGTPNAVVLNSVAFGIIGDSTYHDENYGDPMLGIPGQLLEYSGRVATIVSNQSAPGTTSINWSDTSSGSLLSNAIAAFTTGNATHVMLGLGTNDCRSITNTTASAYHAAMLTICNALVAAGFKVILNYPTKPLITAGSNTWPQSAIDLNLTYRPQVDSLVNGTTILKGDVRLADYLFDNPECYQGGKANENPLVGGFHQSPKGIEATARLLAEGLEFALNPSARTLGTPQTLPSILNSDLSVNFLNRNTYFDNWSATLWDERIGAKYSWVHPGSPPDTRITLYNPPDVNDRQLRDYLGTGNTITIDGDLGNPGHNLVTLEAATRVLPWNWCVAHPGVDPGVGNYRLGLPNEATDRLDPENNSAGYVTTTGDITRAQYIANPSGYTIISGKGDGFTPNTVFLAQHRQQWINLNSSYFQQTAGGNYWSVFGHVSFIADDPNMNCGVLRMDSFAYYNLCFAISPRNAGGPIAHNDTDPNGDNAYTYLYWRAFQYGDFYGARYEGPVTSFSDSTVYQVFGQKAQKPICTYRSPYIVCGEALAVDADGMMTILIGSTTRDSDAYPFPVYKFPNGENPVACTLTGMNELAVVAVWDTANNNAKLVIFAMQGYANRNHGTYWYGLANEGSFKGFRRLGSIVLPFHCPDFVLAMTDAQLQAAPDPGSINLSNAGVRAQYNDPTQYGAYISYAKAGFIAVTSKTEGKCALYNMNAWIDYVHSQIVGTADQTAWAAVAAAHDAGTFPPTFAARPDLVPTLDIAFDIAKPTCMICAGYGGPQIGFNYSDVYKMLIGTESGLVRMVNVSKYLDRMNFSGYNPPGATWSGPGNSGLEGTFFVGRGITSMCWHHYGLSNAEIASLGVMQDTGTDHQDRDAHAYSNAVWVCCRGERKVKLVICRFELSVHEVKSAVHHVLEDTRVGDPVHVSVDDRTNILHICGFNDRKLHSFQIGGVSRPAEYDGPVKVFDGLYFPADPVGGKPFNYAGAYSLPGCPRDSSWNNVN